MNPLRLGLIVLLLFAGAVGGVQAQDAKAPAASLFNAEKWQLLTSTGQAFAGIRSEADAGLVLLVCIEQESLATLTFHPPTPLGLAEPPQIATLNLGTGQPLEAVLTARKTLDGSILFVLHDHEPGFRAAINKLMSASALDVAVMQGDAVQSRHKFTLRGSGEAIAKVMQRCGP